MRVNRFRTGCAPRSPRPTQLFAEHMQLRGQVLGESVTAAPFHPLSSPPPLSPPSPSLSLARARALSLSLYIYIYINVDFSLFLNILSLNLTWSLSFLSRVRSYSLVLSFFFATMFFSLSLFFMLSTNRNFNHVNTFVCVFYPFYYFSFNLFLSFTPYKSLSILLFFFFHLFTLWGLNHRGIIWFQRIYNEWRKGETNQHR